MKENTKNTNSKGVETKHTENRESLLNRKKANLVEILRISRIFHESFFEVLTSSTDSANSDNINKACEEYISLYEKRTSFFNKIANIDSELSKTKPSSDESVIEKEMKDIASSILELDKENVKLKPKLKEHVAQALKEINRGRLTRNTYGQHFEDFSSSYIDSKH